MIKTLHIKNFKSLRDVRLNLGALNIFMGANASGKSNIFDALRVLQGIGNGFTAGEIFDGKPKSATSEIWEGIRGGSSHAAFKGNESEPVSFEVETALFPPTSSSRGETRKITFAAPKDMRLPFTWTPHWLENEKRIGMHEMTARLARSLANMQRFEPIPATLREYSKLQSVSRMGEHGENFAALIQKIRGDSATKDAYLSWLKQLRPAEVDDVITLEGAVGEKMFALKEGGRVFPAPVLSDGTLRFAAIAAAFFQPDMPELLAIEEIENGIHASRLRLLVELLRGRAESQATQVIVTTHSPVVLAWLHEREYAHVFFCKRDGETGASQILPLAEIPRFTEIAKRQPVGDLFAEGWMEAAP